MPLFVARVTSRCLHRCFSKNAHRLSSTWADFPPLVSDPSNKVQVYTSKSSDPFFNLAIEHYLFQKTPPGSRVLFFYRNLPCVVIGRNQNPWLEVNLNLIAGFKHQAPLNASQKQNALQIVPLVRRRSGGGTVFHDQGNVNWSVICDLNEFTRDKHAEMVVRALRKLGVDRARVNERHDIVLDQGTELSEVDLADTHVTPYTGVSSENPPLKVSGSAYKLARNRALHHGTALLNSPNLEKIPLYLRSPAKPFITAKGVGSVSSPVGNIGLGNKQFELAVQQEFNEMYEGKPARPYSLESRTKAKEFLDIPEIQTGYNELKVSGPKHRARLPMLMIKSLEWTYLQTPQFTISCQPVSGRAPTTTVSAYAHGYH
jgi:lipoate---protein ligase